MTRVLDESPVALDMLDGHLKALLRLKIREFVHLNPCFTEMPATDSTHIAAYRLPQPDIPEMVMRHGEGADCPNRKQNTQVRRRPVRTAVYPTN